jgi:hypothetical protein
LTGATRLPGATSPAGSASGSGVRRRIHHRGDPEGDVFADAVFIIEFQVKIDQTWPAIGEFLWVPFFHPFFGAIVPEVPLAEPQAGDEGEAGDILIGKVQLIIVVGFGLLLGEVHDAGGESAASIGLGAENNGFRPSLDPGPRKSQRIVSEHNVRLDGATGTLTGELQLDLGIAGHLFKCPPQQARETLSQHGSLLTTRHLISHRGSGLSHSKHTGQQEPGNRQR